MSGPAVTALLDRLSHVKASGGNYVARCPAHDDKVQSLSIAQGEKGAIAKCHAGCRVEAVIGALGMEMSDLFDEQKTERVIDHEYDYHDADGTLAYQVVRYRPKGFMQRRPNGAGDWVWDLKTIARVPYRLPRILAAPMSKAIIIVEGEKDADRLAELGFIATCNAGGAGKWDQSWAVHFAKRRVVIIPDNDDPGREHAATIKASLKDVAAGVHILELDVPDKGDVSDWLDAGHTRDELYTLLMEAISSGVAPTLGEFLKRGEDEAIDIIPDVIPSGALIVFGGEPRSFKTVAAMQLMFAVASGRDWLGREPTVTGPVLYVSEEGSRKKVQERMWALRGVFPPTNPVHVLHREGIRFSDPAAWGRVRDTLAAMDGPRILVADTYAALADGEENDVAAARAALRPVQQCIADFGVTAILVHHLNKYGDGRVGKRLRGSGYLWGACDGVLAFDRDVERGEALNTGTIRVEPKDGDPTRIRFDFDAQNLMLIAEERPRCTVESIAEEIGRRYEESGNTVAGDEIMRYFGAGRSWFYERLRECVERGLIEKVAYGQYKPRAMVLMPVAA